jgi:ribose/xylose/arabinose/galactoside ABC-type transport system permease subunit
MSDLHSSLVHKGGLSIMIFKPTVSGLRDTGRSLLVSQYFVLVLTIIYFLIVWSFVPWMGNAANLGNILSNMWPLLAAAVGQTFVLVLAGIDLSQVAVMAVASAAGSAIMVESVNPVLFEKSPLWGVLVFENGGVLAGHFSAVPVAILVILCIGIIIGMINGVSIAVFRMPPFIVTLISMMFFGSFAIFLTKSENFMNLPEGFTSIAIERFGPLSFSLLISLALVLFAHLILGRSVLGRWMYAVGLNRRASRVSGVPTKSVIVFAYAFSGFCAAVSGLLFTSRLQVGRPVAGGLTMMLQIIGANVIGGMSLSGGKGKITWTFFGVLFFVVLSNSLSQMNLDSFSVNIVQGFVILMAALLDVARNRIHEGTGTFSGTLVNPYEAGKEERSA